MMTKVNRLHTLYDTVFRLWDYVVLRGSKPVPLRIIHTQKEIKFHRMLPQYIKWITFPQFPFQKLIHPKTPILHILCPKTT